jgi:hypothetical protein
MRRWSIDFLAFALVGIGLWETYQDGCGCHMLKSFTAAASILLLNRGRKRPEHFDDDWGCRPVLLKFPRKDNA